MSLAYLPLILTSACAPKNSDLGLQLLYEQSQATYWEDIEQVSMLQAACDDLCFMFMEEGPRHSIEPYAQREMLNEEIQKFNPWGYLPYDLQRCIDEINSYD